MPNLHQITAFLMRYHPLDAQCCFLISPNCFRFKSKYVKLILSITSMSNTSTIFAVQSGNHGMEPDSTMQKTTVRT